MHSNHNYNLAGKYCTFLVVTKVSVSFNHDYHVSDDDHDHVDDHVKDDDDDVKGDQEYGGGGAKPGSW